MYGYVQIWEIKLKKIKKGEEEVITSFFSRLPIFLFFYYTLEINFIFNLDWRLCSYFS